MYSVYAMICITPNHVYVGETSNLANRLKAHRYGEIAFTRRHGILECYVISTHTTEDGAKSAERDLVLYFWNHGVRTAGGGWTSEDAIDKGMARRCRAFKGSEPPLNGSGTSSGPRGLTSRRCTTPQYYC